MSTVARLNVNAVEQIREKVRNVVTAPKSYGVLSTGERLAVAMVLDRYDLLEGYGMLDAIDRLGSEWYRAALYVKRHGWDLDL